MFRIYDLEISKTSQVCCESFLKSQNPQKGTKTINSPSWNFSVTSPGTSLGGEGSSGSSLGGEGSSGTSLGEEGSFESILNTAMKAFRCPLKEFRYGTERV